MDMSADQGCLCNPDAEGGRMRPLILNVTNLGVADIALREIIEDKMGFEMPEIVKPTRMAGNRRNRPQGWARPNIAANKQAA